MLREDEETLHNEKEVQKIEQDNIEEYTQNVRGVLGNKCAGPHNLKTVQIREIMWK